MTSSRTYGSELASSKPKVSLLAGTLFQFASTLLYFSQLRHLHKVHILLGLQHCFNVVWICNLIRVFISKLFLPRLQHSGHNPAFQYVCYCNPIALCTSVFGQHYLRNLYGFYVDLHWICTWVSSPDIINKLCHYNYHHVVKSHLSWCVLTTFAIEAAAPLWFAPVQQQLNNIEQQLHRVDTKTTRVCPYPCLLTLLHVTPRL